MRSRPFLGVVAALAATAALAVPGSAITENASAAIAAPHPELVLTPDELPREELPAEIEVRGYGYHPETSVVLSVGGEAVAEVPIDGAGGFQAAVEVPRQDCGVVEVLGVQTSGDEPEIYVAALAPSAATPRAQAPLTVTCRGQALAVRPGVVATGTTVTVEGSGFRPGAVVTLLWVLPDGTTLPCTGASAELAASRRGTFETTCLVLPRDRLGPRTMTTPDEAGHAALLVVPGPLEPSRRGFSTGHRLLNRR